MPFLLIELISATNPLIVLQKRCRNGKGVKVKTTLIAWYESNLYPGHVVASLMDETLYDVYLCLVALNKQQI